LKWLTGALGDARDWDVFTTKTLPILLDGFGDATLGAELLAAAERKRAAAGAEARAALASPRQLLLLISIGRWLCDPAQHLLLPRNVNAEVIESNKETPLPSLQDFAAQEIRRRHKRLLRNALAVAQLPVAARHEVRIDAKRLRYSVDFFAGLFDHKRVAPYVKTLTVIQDLLGETNDHAVAMQRLETLSPPAAFMDFSRGWFAAHSQLKLETIDKHIAKLNKVKRFWRKPIAGYPVEESGSDAK
jgi:CHAD domain-containing protein